MYPCWHDLPFPAGQPDTVKMEKKDYTALGSNSVFWADRLAKHKENRKAEISEETSQKAQYFVMILHIN